ncbi:MAG: DUF4382 domain-containing protein [Bacteroidota bacterium]
MKTIFSTCTKAILFASMILFSQACSDSSDNNTAQSGDVEFQMTDAPSDDANISGVFVTVIDVQVDGTSISGFTKQTIDLKAFSEGNAKLLATTRLAAKDYSNLTLVIDNDTDASGAAPGSYVLTNDGVKYKLRSGGTISITLNNSWTVAANSKSTIILDFDIRKAVRQVSDPAIRYNFVSNDNLQASIRLMNQSKVGTINGSYNETSSITADKIVVYSYKKGTFDQGIETTPQGDDAILFKNAVNSAEVKGSLSARSYKLAFVEAGDYEVYFASYKKDASNHFIFQNKLASQLSINGSAVSFVTVQAGVTSSVTSTITGL